MVPGPQVCWTITRKPTVPTNNQHRSPHPQSAVKAQQQDQQISSTSQHHVPRTLPTFAAVSAQPMQHGPNLNPAPSIPDYVHLGAEPATSTAWSHGAQDKLFMHPSGRHPPNHGTNGKIREASPKPPGRYDTSRRGSAITINSELPSSGQTTPMRGTLRCNSVNCKSRGFASDHQWLEHITHCRMIGYGENNKFQCAFNGCASSNFSSMNALYDHELENHQIWLCIDCSHAFPGQDRDAAIDHSKVCQTGGGTRGRQGGIRIRRLWVKDLNWLLGAKEQSGIGTGIRVDRSTCYDLSHSTRPDGTSGEIRQSGIDNRFELTSSRCFMTGNSTWRNAMITQVVNTLKTQYEFLHATGPHLELTLEEKVTMKKYLGGLAELLGVEACIQTAQKESLSQQEAVSAPQIRILSNDARMDELSPSTKQMGEEVTPGGSAPATEKECITHTTEPKDAPHSWSIIQAEQSVTVTHSTVQMGKLPEALNALPSQPNSATTPVIAMVEGEPVQETTLPNEQQHEYFSKLLICCREAVREFYDAHEPILTTAVESVEEVPSVVGLGLGSPVAVSPNSKHKKKKSTGLVPKTTIEKFTLPQSTNYLRRLCDEKRLPKEIVANLDSFGGEVQPVDEVWHAWKKGKVKSDRDLLALVQVARKFCWQLRDWERCRLLDTLYGTIEGVIKLRKEEEGWKVVERRKPVHKRENSFRIWGERAQGASSSGGGKDVLSAFKAGLQCSQTWPKLTNGGSASMSGLSKMVEPDE